MHIRSPRPWDRRGASLPPVLDEQDFLDRRQVLKALGMGGAMAAAAPLLACQEAKSGIEPNPRTAYARSEKWLPAWRPAGGPELYPAKRNDAFPIRRSLTSEDKAAGHNNFYEFLPGHAGPVYRKLGGFTPRPWQVSIAGEVEQEKTADVDELARIAPLEERLYHFRCVEAWSMVVPWTGIPLKSLVEWCRPKPSARFLRFVTFGEKDLDAEQKKHVPPGFAEASYYPWPYYEALRLDEATNPLALLVTGIYGHGLPMQHGAPVRVIVPWKYGYKSPKSIVHIEFTSAQPGTFWSDLQPSEYPFLSNVEPTVPHPRWSQATETDIATGDRIPTLLYNGYGEYVAQLYG